MNPSLSIYDNLGGAEGVRAIIEAFYPRVYKDPLLSPLFPKDMEPVKEKQYMFLSQFLEDRLFFLMHMVIRCYVPDI